MATKAILMMCGQPHAKQRSERLWHRGPRAQYVCPCEHEGTRCFSHVDAAIRLARERRAPVLVFGDAFRDHADVRAFVKRAVHAGVEAMGLLCTIGPADVYAGVQTAAHVLAQEKAFVSVNTICLLADPWGIPLIAPMAQAALQKPRAADDKPFVLETIPVNLCWRPTKTVLREGRRQLRAFLRQRGLPVP